MLPVHVTVAAIVENDGKFLMVEEHTSLGIGFNQPAGHLDPDESLEHAVRREVLEETGLQFNPESLVGIYTLNPASNGRYYQRFCFTGNITGTLETKPQDPDIIAAHWMTLEEILACRESHRSGLTVKCIEDYLNGQRYSLSTLHHSSNEEHLQKQSLKFLNQQL